MTFLILRSSTMKRKQILLMVLIFTNLQNSFKTLITNIQNGLQIVLIGLVQVILKEQQDRFNKIYSKRLIKAQWKIHTTQEMLPDLDLPQTPTDSLVSINMDGMM